VPLYLLRHGETVDNVAGRFQGQNDSELTEVGRQQARDNGRVLNSLIAPATDLKFVSSPLGRTQKTSRIICTRLGRLFDSVETDPRLMEMHYGAWQGMTEFEIEQEYPGQWESWNRQPATYPIPGGGESYDQLFQRVDDWLEDTGVHWQGEAAWIAVSHGGIGSVICGRYLGLPLAEMRQLARPHDRFYELHKGQITTHAAS